MEKKCCSMVFKKQEYLITAYSGDWYCSEVCNSFYQYIDVFIRVCDEAFWFVCALSLWKCAAARSRVLVHLSDRTVGAVLSSLANFGTSDFGAPIQHPPYTHTRLHADSRQHALTHTLMHRRTLSRTQNLGIPVGPGGREEADGGQWAGHLSCVAALRPLTMERGNRRVVPFFPLSPFRGDFCISQWSFCPLVAFFPAFNHLNLLLFCQPFFFYSWKRKQNLRSSLKLHYSIHAGICICVSELFEKERKSWQHHRITWVN